MTSTGESVEDIVFETAKRLLSERVAEESESQAWATGSEIAHVTGFDKDVVLAALRDLHEVGLLHAKPAAAGQEIEVLGVGHGPGADSLDEPVDEG
jgi:hypothetical protein